MSRFSDLVSKPARDMTADVPVPVPKPATARSGSSLIKLDSNENPFGPSPLASAAMKTAIENSNCYPDDGCSALRRKLSIYHDLPPEQILVTAGSTEMLALLCQTLLAPGMNAVTSERSFVVYGMLVRVVGAELILVPMKRNDDGFDLEAILCAINKNTRLVFLANPNNPTGTVVDVETIDSFLAKVPDHVVVVLDEAYYEFACHFAALRKTEYSRALRYVRGDRRVVVLRTFSKAHGLAGLRIGYGLGPSELMSYCARMRNTFSVPSVAQSAAQAALDDQPHVDQTVSNNSSQAEVLIGSLTELGYRIVLPWANFLYCDLRQDARIVADRLSDLGIMVRPLGAWGAPTCIRITIGTPEQNDCFLAAFRKVASTRVP